MKFSVRMFCASAVVAVAGTIQAQSTPTYSYYDEAPASGVAYRDALANGGTEASGLIENKSIAKGVSNTSLYGGACCDSHCGCYDCCCGPSWVVRAGAVILTRNGPSFTVPAGQAITESSDFDWVGGPDIYVAKNINGTDWIEARYFSVRSWNADYTLDDGFAIFEGDYNARLYSTEINLRRQYSDRLALLVGFRWVELHEQFNNELAAGGFSFSTGTGNYLYGAQIGADGVLWSRGGPFRVEGWAKAGIFGTHATGHFVNSVDFDETTNEGEVSFVGDLAINGVYQVNDRIGLRAGYQLLWIEGVATAGDQLQYSVTPPPLPLDTSGGIFAHGVLLGVDFTW